MTDRLTHTSKFLSFVLRHKPEAIGIELDSEGWTSLDALIRAADRAGTPLDRELIQQVVESNDKQRFRISEDGERIRAAQGHSTKSVTLTFTAKEPPEFLYHGTASRFLDAILKEGLRPGQRHHVHLSKDKQTAVNVGQRHGAPVVLKIAALQMHQLGHSFYLSDNGVWLTNEVSTAFIQSD